MFTKNRKCKHGIIRLQKPTDKYKLKVFDIHQEIATFFVLLSFFAMPNVKRILIENF